MYSPIILTTTLSTSISLSMMTDGSLRLALPSAPIFFILSLGAFFFFDANAHGYTSFKALFFALYLFYALSFYVGLAILGKIDIISLILFSVAGGVIAIATICGSFIFLFLIYVFAGLAPA